MGLARWTAKKLGGRKEEPADEAFRKGDATLQSGSQPPKKRRDPYREAYVDDVEYASAVVSLRSRGELPEGMDDLVRAEIDRMRAVTQSKINKASEVELSVEQAELLKKMEAQYPAMKATLEHYEISTKGMPTWEQVKKGLTPEVLDKALKLSEPTLLLVPPTTRKSKVKAINMHPAEGQKFDVFADTLDDNNCWNGGNLKSENKWRVQIVDGIQNVALDNQIYDGMRTNYEMSKLWVKKFEDQGLDAMNDADAYLTLMMKGLAEGKPIDAEFYTVLNGKNMTKPAYVAGGYWRGVRVCLFRDDPDFVRADLRLRGSVGVDVPEAA